jgi:hypothetical protein
VKDVVIEKVKSSPNSIRILIEMAGNSAKKIQEKNKDILAFYKRIHLASLISVLSKIGYNCLSSIPLALSANLIGNIFLLISNQIVLLSFQSMASQGSDLSSKGGMVSFLVDVFLLSWFVINCTTWISNYFAYTLIFIPIFGIIKLKQVWNSLFSQKMKKKG